MARKPGARLDTEQVVREAGALVDEEGQEQLSLTRLAERLNIRTPSLYNHVASLEQLRRDVALLATRDLLARLAKATQGAYAHEHPGLYNMTLRAPDPEDVEFQAVAQETLDLLLETLKPYGLSGENALHVVRAFRSMAHGFVSLELLGGFGLPLELDKSYSLLLHIFIDGMEVD